MLSQKAREGSLTPTEGAEASTSSSEWLTFSRSCNLKHTSAQARRLFGINPWGCQQS